MSKEKIMRKNNNQWSGYFWLPNDAEQKLPGTLTIEGDGSIYLELIGSFKLTSEDIDESRINGTVENLGFVTLDQCFYTSKPLFPDSIQKSLIISNQVIIGCAYGSDEKLEFNKATFEIDNLDRWVGISGLTHTRFETPHSYKIEFSLPKTIEHKLANGMTLQIDFGYKIPSPTTSKAAINQYTFFRLSSDMPRPLKDFRDCAFKLNNLLSLSMNQSATMRNFKLYHDELMTYHGNGVMAPIGLKLIYRASNYREEPAEQHWREMIFTYRQIRDNPEKYINNWLNLYDICEPALNLFFSTLNEPTTFSESKFLALAQSLETFHRRTTEATLMPSEDYEKFSQDLLKVAPENAREWLSAKLKFGNEITFKQRLLDLIDPFKSLLVNSKTKKRIAHKIVTSRNYYTHYNPNLEGDAQKGVDLLNLTYTMEALCKLIFMEKLGFEVKSIEEMITYSVKQALQAESRNTDEVQPR